MYICKYHYYYYFFFKYICMYGCIHMYVRLNSHCNWFTSHIWVARSCVDTFFFHKSIADFCALHMFVFILFFVNYICNRIITFINTKYSLQELYFDRSVCMTAICYSVRCQRFWQMSNFLGRKGRVQNFRSISHKLRHQFAYMYTDRHTDRRRTDRRTWLNRLSSSCWSFMYIFYRVSDVSFWVLQISWLT